MQTGEISSFEDFQDLSSAMSNLFTQGSEGAAHGAGVSAFVEEGRANVSSIGRMPRVKNRLFPRVDLASGTKAEVPWGATSDYVMSRAAAGRKMEEIYNACGVVNETDGVKYAFVHGMLFAFAINSSSVRMPGRATFEVAGKAFDLFADVVSITGNDTRRFFRAYADVTRQALEDLQSRYNAGPAGESDEELDAYEDVKDQWSNVLRVANVRGLGRVPTLIHDSADACSGLTTSERAYLNASARSIFAEAAGGNSLDNPSVPRTHSNVREGAAPSGSGGLLDNY